MKKVIAVVVAGLMVLVAISISASAAVQQPVQVQYGRLQGTVADGDDNPIEGAFVYIFGGYINFEDPEFAIVGKKAYTDADGFYSFDIPAGKYTMLVTMEGYLPSHRLFVVVSPEEIEVANFNLISIDVHNALAQRQQQQQSLA